MPKEKSVYVRLAAMRDQPAETIASFGLRLRQFLEKEAATRNLIVDPHGNSGGNTLYF